MANSEEAKLLDYFFEVGQLKYVKHCGWWMAKIRDPESVAEHSFRAAIIAYVLANKENHVNPEKVALGVLFHDVHEARLLDRHKMASNYQRIPKELERKVEREQCDLLGKTGDKIFDILDHEPIAKDADYLEQAITAKEYLDAGNKDAQVWIDRVGEVLQTETAKALWKLLKNADSGAWWKRLLEDVEKSKY